MCVPNLKVCVPILTGVVTDDNYETLISLSLLLLAPRGLLVRVSERFHNGGAARGKSVSIESDLYVPRVKPWNQKLLNKKQWDVIEKARCEKRNAREVCERLAMGHLIFHFNLAPLGTTAVSSIEQSAVTAVAKNRGMHYLAEEQYAFAWARLTAMRGPVSLLPAAAVRSTPTRWDLAHLLICQATRGEAPLLSIIPPNERALANGMLRKELSAGSQQEWETPMRVLCLHRQQLRLPPPPLPPITFLPTNPPVTLGQGQAIELKQWCQSHLWNKRQESADRSEHAASSLVGQTRQRTRTRRLVESDSSNSDSSNSDSSAEPYGEPESD